MMNNIYDVVLNFNEFYYEVYEWRDCDNIKSVRKLPFFKVSDKDYIVLKNKKVKVSIDTFKLLLKRSSVYDENNNKITCIVTNGITCMGIVIDESGFVVLKSSMLFDEEEEVIEEAGDLEEVCFVFDLVEDTKYLGNRLVHEKKDILYNFINNVSNKMILKYLYYDYYLVECNDIEKIKNDFINEIDSCDYYSLLILYDKIMLFLDYVK